MRIELTVLGVVLDARILDAASSCGRSIVYLRLDFGTRTAFLWDLEFVAKRYRSRRAVEYLARLGPLQTTNRSYYVGD